MGKLIADYLAENPYSPPVKPQEPPKKKGPGGIAGFLVDNLPAISSGIGAVGGSFLAPGVGTIGGGAYGGAFGEALKRQILGETLDPKEIGIQAVEGGLLSGIGGAGKGIQSGAKYLTKLGIDEGAEEAAGQTVKSAKQPFMQKLLQNTTTQGQQMQGRTAGVSAGIGKGGKEIVPQDTERMLSTLKNEGIDTSNANFALRDVTTKQKAYGKQIADHFKNNDAPLHPKDAQVIGSNFLAQAQAKTTDPAYLREAKILANDLPKNVKSTSDVWKFRVGLDDRIPDTKFASDQTTAKIAAIKDMRTYLANEIGDIPGAKQYHDLSELKPLIGKEANRLNNPGGGILGRLLATGPVQKLENTAGIGLEKVGQRGATNAQSGMADDIAELGLDEAPKQNVFQRIVGATANPVANPGKTAGAVLKQEVGRGFGIPASTSNATNQAGMEVGDGNALLDDGSDTADDSTQGSSPYDAVNVGSNIDAIRQQGGTEKDIAAYLSNAKAYQDMLAATGGSGTKPVSATAADAIANAGTGLDSLNIIRQELAKDPSVQSRQALAQVANPFGITSRLAGTGNYDAAITQVKDVIARLRTGAAISNSEEKRFTAMLPQPADSSDVVNQKLSQLEQSLQTVVTRVGGNSSDILQEAAAAAQ